VVYNDLHVLFLRITWSFTMERKASIVPIVIYNDLCFIFKNHMKFHSGEKGFNCSHCPERFEMRKFLQNHLIIAHQEKEDSLTTNRIKRIANKSFKGMWLSYCCLTPHEQFSAISWQEQVTFPWVNDDVHFVLHLWCSLCTMMSTFQPYHDENIGWNDDDISFVIDKNMLSWIFIELACWNNSPRVDMLLHSDPLF
jgi:hypothetical protein